MDDAITHEAAIIYVPKFREYGIHILDGGSSYMTINYCPWCGALLPSSLREQWFDRLEELGLEPDSENLPVMLTTDGWWRTS